MKPELGKIQKTLLFPLWGRAIESQKPDALLVDEKAVEIIDKIDFDFSTFKKSLSEISKYGWVMRSLLIDKAINRFLEKHPKATVVDIGCGLDTTFERVDNGKLRWYDLDLPDTIALRKRFFSENERRKFIASSFLDNGWLDQMIVEDNILFISAGVLYYFNEEEVKGFIKRVAEKFPGSEFVFDATSPRGVKMANKMVLKRSKIENAAFLVWGIKHAKELESWDKHIKVLEEKLFFEDIPKKLPLKTRMQLSFSDLLKIQYLIHLKFI